MEPVAPTLTYQKVIGISTATSGRILRRSKRDSNFSLMDADSELGVTQMPELMEMEDLSGMEPI